MKESADIIKKWRSKDGIQPKEDINDVLKVLRDYGFDIRGGAKHRIVASHKQLNDLNYHSMGIGKELVIPTQGKKVIKLYIKTLLKYLELLEVDNENRGS
jgi:hypothetical protein